LRDAQSTIRPFYRSRPGTRNETANLCAFRIGQLVGGGCLTEREAYAALANAALGWGIKANDKALGPRGTIMRAIQAGAREPCSPPPDPSNIIVLKGLSQSL
jgi:hypothetical protein